MTASPDLMPRAGNGKAELSFRDQFAIPIKSDQIQPTEGP
jgi:hypothetical protein